MFTGLIQTVGTIAATTPTAAGQRLTIALASLTGAPISAGDSVCVSGVCLTALPLTTPGHAAFDVVTETLRRTTLGDKRPGDRVNLELSLRPDSFVGGHFVQGHVDAIARVTAVQSLAGDWRITFQPTPDAMPCIVPKGSVAVDGVSMTIAATTADTFTLAVIPTTLERTTLATLNPGDTVNIETDILARTVVHYLQNLGIRGSSSPESAGQITSIENRKSKIENSPLTLAKLIAAGFA